jgi:hypothetical protein
VTRLFYLMLSPDYFRSFKDDCSNVQSNLREIETVEPYVDGENPST